MIPGHAGRTVLLLCLLDNGFIEVGRPEAGRRPTWRGRMKERKKEELPILLLVPDHPGMALGSGLPAPHPLLPTEALFFLEGILVHQVCSWQLTLVRQMVQAMCCWTLLFLEHPFVLSQNACPPSPTVPGVLGSSFLRFASRESYSWSGVGPGTFVHRQVEPWSLSSWGGEPASDEELQILSTKWWR